MKDRQQRKKLINLDFTRMVIVVAALFLIMPTILTIAILKKADKTNSKLDNMSMAANARVLDENVMLDSDSALYADESLLTEDIIPEKDTTEPNPLLMASGASLTDASVSDASTSDAAESDVAEVSKTSDTDATETADAAKAPAEVVPNGKKVYLTFDDGPTDHTEELLDVLAKYNVKATFFVVADSDKYADSLKRMVKDGHTLGLHSACHVYSKLYADMDSYIADVDEVHDVVQSITGYDAKYYRFPGGSSNNVSNVPISDCIKYLHDNGYEYYDWNAFSRDAENIYLTPEQLNDNVMYYVRNNEGDSVVLLHDLQDQHNTIDSLPDLIETLLSEGYELCALDENAPLVQHYVP